MMYQQTTDKIHISVEPFYLENDSQPQHESYVWAYRIKIENHGDETVQLESRYWQITDMVGRIKCVEGRGVVGEEPVLGPGESFIYCSGVPLKTPSGIMEGHYMMRNKHDGSSFKVMIPAFSLDLPEARGKLN